MSYKSAGVDIRAGESFVKKIQAVVRSSFRPEVIGDLGGFGGLFALDLKKYKNPVLVSGTDGVGTKLHVAQLMDRHDTVGIDLVAMCVNDVLVSGAEPLFFLDYVATGRLEQEIGVAIVKGIVKGCKSAGCALIGGETAEMPSFYPEGVYDLAGFSVGLVERKKIIDGRRITPGDILIGLASSGLHSNGYSLARKVLFEKAGLKITDAFPGRKKTIGEELLTPTRIYVKTILRVLKEFDVKGLAHITGGGLSGNIPRILPEGCSVRIHRGSWRAPAIFDYLQENGQIALEEMYRVFNMGIGMVIVIAPALLGRLMRLLYRLGERAYPIGAVISTRGRSGVVYA